MTLAHDVTGDGDPVLLLHSTAADRRMWDAQVTALAAAGRRVVRCDLRGYGDSPAPTEPWNDADEPSPELRAFGAFARIAADLARRLPDARHTELGWAGHLPALERPDEISALLVQR